MNSDLEQIKKDIADIKACLIGSLGSYGLVDRVKYLEKRGEASSLKLAGIAAIIPIFSTLIMHFAVK